MSVLRCQLPRVAKFHFDPCQSRLQPNKWPDRWLHIKAAIKWGVEAFVVLPTAAYFVLVPILQMRAAEKIPALPIVMLQLLIMLFMTDFLFYCAHRTLHHPALYSWIHKTHHEFKITVVFAFEYSHPIETVANILTVTIPPFILATHPLVTSISIAIRMWESCKSVCLLV